METAKKASGALAEATPALSRVITGDHTLEFAKNGDARRAVGFCPDPLNFKERKSPPLFDTPHTTGPFNPT